jgi:hypothetical protein
MEQDVRKLVRRKLELEADEVRVLADFDLNYLVLIYV